MDSLSSNPPSRRAFLLALLMSAVAMTIAGCSRPTIVEEIKQERVLHVITRNAPTTYFEGRDGATGFEYELAKLFAEELGVELRLRTADNLGEIYEVLGKNYTHFAATGLSLPAELSKRYHVTTPYLQITQKVVYRQGTPKPRSTTDLVGKRILVMANSSYAEALRHLRDSQLPELTWTETSENEVVDLLRMVDEGEIELTIADSNELSVYQAYYPKVAEAFDLSEPQPVSWIFPATRDDSLQQQAQAFFQRIEQDGTLLQLKERFYGHVDQLNYVGARTFLHHIGNRLPLYEPLFQEAGEKYGVDWRLLAAMSYQESHWRPNAVSPTGVRGLMMLTLATAKELGIHNRLDPRNSIMGGAQYFALIRDRIPARIPEPDRSWLALASYNVGYGHLEDARILTERQGLNPDKWIDVKQHLPLLQKAKWYRQTKYGYARGLEPVQYVQNIRRYYDVLAWMTQPEPAATQVAEQETSTTTTPQVSAQINVPQPFQSTPPML